MVFAKNPVKGKVKTRLAHSIGHEHALDVYNLLLTHTLNVSKAVSAETIVFFSDSISHNLPAFPKHLTLALQSGNDLGEKMCNAFQQSFANGYGPVAIIGTDCFELTPEIVDKAFALLRQHEVVIGPAIDGGYYLLGMQRLVPELFTNKHWSTASVFEDTIRDLEQLHISYALLRELSDIDNVEDLNKSAIKH